MPAPVVRRFLRFAVVLSVAAVLVALSLPWIASTQIVRDRIAQELAILTGYDVSIASAPEIKIWPTFRAVLRDVRFIADPARPPVLEAERIEANLLALASLEGRIVFSGLTLVRPVLRVNRSADYYFLPDPPLSGRLPPLFGLLEGSARGEGFTEIRIGTIRFNDGRVTLVEGGAATDMLSSLTGTIGWPGAGRPASLNATGIWRGEQIAVAAFAAQPEALVAGAPSPVMLSLQSSPLTFSLDGTASRTDRVTVNGAVSASSPSLRRALEWSDAHISPGAAMGAVSLKGNLSGNLARLRLSDAQIALDGNPGEGALEFATDGPVPGISGTLAFQTLDLGSFLSAFESPGAGAGADAPMFDLGFTDQISLDLRLSAARASGANIELSGVAATAQVRRGLAAFDISDATAFGGTVQAGFRVDRKAEGDIGEIRVTGAGIDWASAAAAARWPFPPPRARGSGTLHLRGPIGNWANAPRAVTGTLSASFEAGTFEGVNLQGLLDHRPESGFFPLSEVANGSMAFDRAELKAAIGDGTARIETATAWTPRDTVELTGIVPYVGRSLALGGTVTPRDKQAGPVRRFFVGGSWASPYISTAAGEWGAE